MHALGPGQGGSVWAVLRTTLLLLAASRDWPCVLAPPPPHPCCIAGNAHFSSLDKGKVRSKTCAQALLQYLACRDALVVWAVHHLVEVVLLQDVWVIADVLYEDEANATAAQRSRLQQDRYKQQESQVQ